MQRQCACWPPSVGCSVPSATCCGPWAEAVHRWQAANTGCCCPEVAGELFAILSLLKKSKHPTHTLFGKPQVKADSHCSTTKTATQIMSEGADVSELASLQVCKSVSLQVCDQNAVVLVGKVVSSITQVMVERKGCCSFVRNENCETIWMKNENHVVSWFL